MRLTVGLLSIVALFSVAIAVDLKVGFVLPPPSDEYHEISQRVLNGIRFWANETKDWQLGANAGTKGSKYSNFPIIVEQTGPAESIGTAYVRLAPQVDVLVGPVGTAALADVAASLRQAGISKIMSVPNGDAMYYSGRSQPSANSTLIIDANSTYPNMLSLLPPYAIFTEQPTLNLTVFKRLLEKKKVYQYGIISVAADPNSEIDTFAYNAGLALANDLRKDPTRVISYSVEIYGTYSNQAELNAFMVTFANLRPQPDVLVLSVPTYNRSRVEQVIAAMGAAKVDPDVVLWMFPIDNPEELEPKSSRRLYKYQTALSFWGDSLDTDGGKSFLGSALRFSEHYESRYSKKVLIQKPTSQAGTWEAVGAAHAQLIELWLQCLTPTEFSAGALPAADRILYTKRRETFFNRVQFDAQTGRNVAYRLAAYQYYMGEVRSIDEEIGQQDDISRPGRWSWKKYSLNGAAISAIIIGSILAAAGLAVAIWATWHFVDIFLNPPKESDDENEDDDD